MTDPKKSRVAPAWFAPEPICDPPECNHPWPDKNTIPRLNNDKVAFLDDGHLYFLQDQRVAYPDHIISGSKLSTYWDTYQKIAACGSFEDTDPIVQTYEAMSKANRNPSNLPHRRPDFEGDTVPQIRAMFANYINSFVDWGQAAPTFNDRAAKLADCAGEGNAFPHHSQHKALRTIETWLLEHEDHKTPDVSHAWTELLRYIRCPSAEFSHLTAVSAKGGKSLADFLGEEWARINGETPLAPICHEEAKSVPFCVPAMAGTIAHQYIERTFDPNRGPLPELHEAEDEPCIKAMLAHLAKNNVTFLPENIERRVGSHLYKFCGTMDGFRLRDDGVYEVWDWKRSTQVNKWLKLCDKTDDPNHFKVDMSKVPFSNTLMNYCLQAAGYRQGELLSHPEKNISTSAFLGVIHPSLAQKFVIVEIPLADKMQAKSLKTTKGIGNWTAPDGTFMECTEGMTPIEYVKCFLHHRLDHLRRHFGCEPAFAALCSQI